MRYLGALRGEGTLRCGEETLAPAEYDVDGFLVPPGGVAASGEIRVDSKVLRRVFGRKDLQLVTEGGRLLSLRFTEKKLGAEGGAAHIDVTAGLPSAKDWRQAS
jgi:hypothetical protein